jgi:hypothetical protein
VLSQLPYEYSSFLDVPPDALGTEATNTHVHVNGSFRQFVMDLGCVSVHVLQYIFVHDIVQCHALRSAVNGPGDKVRR